MGQLAVIRQAPWWLRWPLWCLAAIAAVVMWAAAAAALDEGGAFETYLIQGLVIVAATSLGGAVHRFVRPNRWQAFVGPVLLAVATTLVVTESVSQPVALGALLTCAMVGGIWSFEWAGTAAVVLGALSAIGLGSLLIAFDGRVLGFTLLCGISASAFAIAWRLDRPFKARFTPKPPANIPPPLTHA